MNTCSAPRPDIEIDGQEERSGWQKGWTEEVTMELTENISQCKPKLRHISGSSGKSDLSLLSLLK